jgi:hypothetical protein
LLAAQIRVEELWVEGLTSLLFYTYGELDTIVAYPNTLAPYHTI